MLESIRICANKWIELSKNVYNNIYLIYIFKQDFALNNIQ